SLTFQWHEGCGFARLQGKKAREILPFGILSGRCKETMGVAATENPAEKFRIALVQMAATPEPAQNLEHAMERVREAARLGAQVVCLPELFQTQYFCQREDPDLFDLAEPVPGPTTNKLSALAKQTGIVLIASLFE